MIALGKYFEDLEMVVRSVKRLPVELDVIILPQKLKEKLLITVCNLKTEKLLLNAW
jgi:hypothetical protein